MVARTKFLPTVERIGGVRAAQGRLFTPPLEDPSTFETKDSEL